MTLKEIDKWITQQQQQQYGNPELERLRSKLRGKKFYDWGINLSKQAQPNEVDCCFNHIIGIPRKGNKEYPLFDYENMLYRALTIPGYLNFAPLQQSSGYTMDEKRERDKKNRESYLHSFKIKHVWVKKATGLGITEFILRFMVWLCFRNDNLKGTQMCIVTGPRIDQAIGLIDRIKKLLEPHNVSFESLLTV
jgi:hypothetical protein